MTTSAEEISNEAQQQALKAVSIARLQLMILKQSGFTSAIATSLKVVVTRKHPVAATDGYHLFIHPENFTKLDSAVRVFVMAHEVWHIVYDHIERAADIEDVNHEIFNEAADHVNNLMLKSKGYQVPNWALANPEFEGMPTEQVYRILLNDPSKRNNSNRMPDIIPNKPNSTEDGDDEQHSVPMSTEDLSKYIDSMIMRAAMQNEALKGTEGCEGLPPQLAKRIKELAVPKLDWKKLFRRFTLERKRDDYSYKRPNRRIDDFYMPSLYNEACKDMVVATDISYSITDKEISAFFAEVEFARRQIKPALTHVIQWHTQIAQMDTIKLKEPLSKINFAETGGTDIYPLFNHLIANPPKSCIIFTDGEFSMWDKPQLIKFPVIWVIYNRHRNGEDWFKPNFGKVVYYEPEIKS